MFHWTLPFKDKLRPRTLKLYELLLVWYKTLPPPPPNNNNNIKPLRKVIIKKRIGQLREIFHKLMYGKSAQMKVKLKQKN